MAIADTHPSAAELDAFTLGTLDEASFEAVESHLAVCPICQEHAASASGDTLVELLRRAHARSVSGMDTLTEAALVPTPGPYEDEAASRTAADPNLCVSAVAADAMPPELTNHDRYRVVRLLGQGGMGAVYEAEHSVMRRLVALKLINRAFTANPAAVERFRREVRAAARLSHPNIVTAYDAETAGQTHFLVMEYVEGVSLARLVKERGPLPVTEACEYARQAALGLQHAHERGMVHRDVKPDNLILATSPSGPGVVKVLDFGLAALNAERGGGLTDTNAIMGTPDYMAPEQAEDSRNADIRADVYSLGCTLYYLLTGNVPYPAATSLLKILAHRDRPVPSVRQDRPEVSPGLSAVLMRMLAKKPEDRYQTPGEVAAALEPFTRVPAPRKPRSRIGLLIAAATVLLALGSAVAVYRVQTDKGELVITTESDDVEVVIKKGGKVVAIIDTKSGKRITLRSGTYELELKGSEGLKLNIDSVTLTRGETVLAKVESVEKKPLEKVGEIRRFEGHTGPVRTVTFSHDGRHVLSGSGWPNEDGDMTIRLWDADTGKEIRQFEGVASMVYSVAMAPDGRRALSCGSPEPQLWNVDTGKEIRRFKRHLSTYANAVAFSHDGRRALSGGGDGDNTVRLWDVESGTEVRQFQGHSAQVFRVVFSSNDLWAVSCSGDKTVRLWEVETGKELKRFVGQGGVHSVAITPDNRHVISASFEEKSLRVWDVESGKQVREFNGHEKFVSVALSPDGRRALSGGVDRTLRLWDVETGKELHCFKGHEDTIWEVSFSPDGRYALSGSADKTIRLWRLPDTPPQKPELPQAEPNKVGEVFRQRWAGKPSNSVELSPDGRYAASGHTDGCRVWEVATGKVVHELPGWMARFTPDGKHVITAEGDFLLIHDSATGALRRKVGPHEGGIWEFRVAPDGRTVVAGGWDTVGRIWDLETGKLLHAREPKDGKWFGCVYSPEGQHIFFGPEGKPPYTVWDVRAGKEVAAYEKLRNVPVYHFLTGRGEVMGWLEDKSLPIHDSTTGRLLRKAAAAKGEQIDNHAIGAARNGRMPVCLKDGTICVLDLATGKEVVRFSAGNFQPWNLAISSDGRFVAATARHKESDVVVWRLPDPPSQTPDSPQAEPGKISLIRRIPISAPFFLNTAISKGGKYALVSSDTKPELRMDVYDVTTGERIFECNGFMPQFLGGGEEVFVASGHKPGKFRVYETRSGKLLREGEHRDLWGVGIAPGGKHALYSGPNHLVLFDTVSMKEMRAWQEDATQVYSANFTPDGKRLLFRFKGKPWTLWDVENNRSVEEFKGLEGVTAVGWLFPDGKTAAAMKDERLVRIELLTGKVLGPLTHPDNSGISEATNSIESRCCLRRTTDGQILQHDLLGWEKEFPKPIAAYQLPPNDRLSPGLWAEYGHPSQAISEDNRFAAVLTTRTLYILRLADLPPVKDAPEKRLGAELPNKTGLVRTLTFQSEKTDLLAQFSADGRLVALPITAPGKGNVYSLVVREVATGRIVREPSFPGQRVTSFLITPDNRRLIVGVEVGVGRFAFREVDLDGDGNRMLDKVPTQAGWPCRFRMDAAGKRLAYCCCDVGPRVVDLESGKMLLQADAPEGTDYLYCLPSADGKRAFTLSAWKDKEVAAGYRGRVRVHDLATGKTLATNDVDHSVVASVLIDPETGQPGTLVRIDGELLIEWFDSTTAKPVRRTSLVKKSEDIGGMVSPRNAVCLFPNKTAKVLSVPTGKELFTLGNLGELKSWWLSDDGRMLGIRVGDEARLYRLPGRGPKEKMP